MKSNEELLYNSWVLEQIDHSKTILVKDQLERQVDYVRSQIEHALSEKFESVVEAIDTLMERLNNTHEV